MTIIIVLLLTIPLVLIGLFFWEAYIIERNYRILLALGEFATDPNWVDLGQMQAIMKDLSRVTHRKLMRSWGNPLDKIDWELCPFTKQQVIDLSNKKT